MVAEIAIREGLIPRSRRVVRRHWGPLLAISVLAHLLAILLILFFVHRDRWAEPPPAGPEIAMVFDRGTAPPGPAKPVSGRAAPIAQTPPDEKSVAPPSQSAASPPSPPAAPQVNVAPQLAPMPPVAMPLPPQPLPEPTSEPLPAARPRPQPHREASHSASPFSRPMNFSFSGGAPPPPSHPGRTRGTNFGFNVPAPAAEAPPGGAMSDNADMRQIGGPALGRDWFGQLREFWYQHRYYPREAAEKGEDGEVVLVLDVKPDGHVRTAEVKTRSGSMWLDAAALSVFRDASLPPFPPGSDQGGDATIELNIVYTVMR